MMAYTAGIIISFVGLVPKWNTIHRSFKALLIACLDQNNIRLFALYSRDFINLFYLFQFFKIMATPASDRTGEQVLCYGF